MSRIEEAVVASVVIRNEDERNPFPEGQNIIKCVRVYAYLRRLKWFAEKCERSGAARDKSETENQIPSL